MDRLTAQHLIDTYCGDVPRAYSLERLMRSTFTAADAKRLNDTGDAETQDRLDEILYAS